MTRFFNIFIPVLGGICLFAGILLLYIHKPAYDVFITEDGVVEWLTVLGLLTAAGICIYRFMVLRKAKKGIFLVFLLFAAFVFIFGAGEEISWGQRLFGIQSGDFFVKHNTQQETNLHNLVLGGTRINKLVFSLILGVCVFIFLFILPILYRKSAFIKKWSDALAVPIPKTHHIASYIILFIAISAIHETRKWELLEMGGALLFLAVVFNPFNKEIFHPDPKEKINPQ